MSDCCKGALQRSEFGSFLEPYSLACLRSVSSDIRTAQHATLVAALRKSVSGPARERRLGAVRALAKLADAESAAAVKVIAECVESYLRLKDSTLLLEALRVSTPEGDVRRAAIDALEEVAGRGNVVAIKA